MRSRKREYKQINKEATETLSNEQKKKILREKMLPLHVFMIECYVNRSARREIRRYEKMFCQKIFGGEGISFIYFRMKIIRALVSDCELRKEKVFVLINSNSSISFKCLTSRICIFLFPPHSLTHSLTAI